MTNGNEYSATFEQPDFSGFSDEPSGEEDLDNSVSGDTEPDVFEHVVDEPSGEDDLVNRVSGGTARAVLEHVARSIVDDRDAVVVETEDGRNGLKLALHVAPSDMGRVIGKRGRVAQAIRAVVRAAASRDGTDAAVDIVD